MSRPDEGLIHAWLDGELDAAEAARVEALVKNDTEWAAVAAEARGLIAASSRIIGSLDDVPADVVPKTQVPSPRTQVTAARRGTPWWMMRAAAVLVVVAGTTVVMLNRNEGNEPLANAVSQAKDAPRAAATSAVGADVQSKPDARVAETDAFRKKADPVGDEAKLLKREAAPVAANEAQSQRVGALADAAGKAAAAQGQVAPSQQQLAQQQQVFQPRQIQSGAGGGAAGPPASAPASALGSTLARADADQKIKTSSDSLARARQTDSLAKETERRDARLSEVVTARAAARGGALDVVTGTRVAPERKALEFPEGMSSREQCFRERVAATGADIVHRVTLSSDTTALPTTAAAPAPADARREFAARARAVSPALRVNGDTLIIPGTVGAVRIAIRVTCPR